MAGWHGWTIGAARQQSSSCDIHGHMAGPALKHIRRQRGNLVRSLHGPMDATARAFETAKSAFLSARPLSGPAGEREFRSRDARGTGLSLRELAVRFSRRPEQRTLVPFGRDGDLYITLTAPSLCRAFSLRGAQSTLSTRTPLPVGRALPSCPRPRRSRPRPRAASAGARPPSCPTCRARRSSSLTAARRRAPRRPRT